MIDRMTRKPSDGFLAIVLDAYSLFIQRCGSGVKCSRSRGPDVSVDISPVISTCGKAGSEAWQVKAVHPSYP